MKFRSHRFPRRLVASVHDTAMAATAFLAALVLRFGTDILTGLTPNLWWALVLFTMVCAVVFHFAGLYRGIWRYASLDDLVAIVRAATLAILIFLAVTFLVTRLEELPRSSLIITWFVLIVLLGAPRVLYRVFKDRGFGYLLKPDTDRRTPVLVIGTGNDAEAFIRQIARDRQAPYEVVGLVDEKGTRIGRSIHGVPILGHLEKLPEILAELKRRGRTPQRLILARRPSAEDLDTVLDVADAHGITLARLPRLTELTSGADAPIELRPVAIEDLLGRTQARFDRPTMVRLIEGRRVLVTGAGGSIGAELARQLADFAPAHLILLDQSEYNLYAIGLELDETHGGRPRSLVLADIREAGRFDQVMAAENPDLVFHAAALKHVPMVEANPVEGILTNAIGTRNVADACIKAGVRAMVLVSTDKAVNPTSVMGATKRLGESYCQALDIAERRRGRSGTRFVTVRFGNVLGSTGSVVPLFHRQIAAGGPLTVTHPEMTRYFMTVREAVELVLQASAMGIENPSEEAGKIYVLEMGNPVKIMDLARQMIRLSGLRPAKDIGIVVTGPRPGERLHEELFHKAESRLPTGHPDLHLASPRTVNEALLGRSLEELARLAAEGRITEALAMIRRLVPEYHPDDAAAGQSAADAS